MDSIKKATAYHEAGHAMAYILLGIVFDELSIIKEENTLGRLTLTDDHVKSYVNECNSRSYLNPEDFDFYFRDGFATLAGIVAEKIYTGKWNTEGSDRDFHNIRVTVLEDMPGGLKRYYSSFLLEYTKEVLLKELNWNRLKVIAEKLFVKKTLSYNEVVTILQ